MGYWVQLQAWLSRGFAGFRQWWRLQRFPGWVTLFCISITLALVVTGCGGTTSTVGKPDVEITLVSFAVTRAAHEAIIPKFAAEWQQKHNQKVNFNRSYGGSGAQTRAVIDGLDADIVHLALALDTNRIVKAGLIEPGWEKELPNNSIASKSVAALVTRPGNPKGIQNWSDLAKDGIRIITADPKTSGVARWNFLALWNAGMKTYSSEIQAQEFVTKVYRNAPILTRDAREASDVFFKQGQGDALINYENEIILAQQKGQAVNYVIPDVNISIDNPVAVVDKNVDKHKNREVTEVFAQFLLTPEAQTEFAKVSFRPVAASVAQQPEFAKLYPPVKNLATVKDFGGWKAIQKKFSADGAMFDQIRTEPKS
jgi:sulfate transport system substrate-binding protein